MNSFNKTSIYVTGLIILVFLFAMSYYKYKTAVETQSNGERIEVMIDKLVCRNTIYNKSYIVFKFDGANHIVNIDMETCNDHRVGDSISLSYNRDSDMFYSVKEDGSNEKWGMIISGLLFSIIVLNLLFPKIVSFAFSRICHYAE